jgi:hypothetical protein
VNLIAFAALVGKDGGHGKSSAFAKDQRAVVGRHGLIEFKLQAVLSGQGTMASKSRRPLARITLAQPGVEGAVAVAGELAAIVERAIDGKHAAFGSATHQGEHALHQRPGHDVAGVAGKDGVKSLMDPVAGQASVARSNSSGARRLGAPWAACQAWMPA